MKLAEALPKMPNLREVKCAACAFPSHETAGYPGHVTHPDRWYNPRCSLNENQLCGLNQYGQGIYTIEGITALCEGMKQSNIQSLR